MSSRCFGLRRKNRKKWSTEGVKPMASHTISKQRRSAKALGVQLDWGDVDIVHNFAAERGEKGIWCLSRWRGSHKHRRSGRRGRQASNNTKETRLLCSQQRVVFGCRACRSRNLWLWQRIRVQDWKWNKWRLGDRLGNHRRFNWFRKGSVGLFSISLGWERLRMDNNHATGSRRQVLFR